MKTGKKTRNSVDDVAVADPIGRTGKHRKTREGAETPRLSRVHAYSKATVPDRERNRHRLNPQLRCQTRFRCELVKQTQSKLGIKHKCMCVCVSMQIL